MDIRPNHIYPARAACGVNNLMQASSALLLFVNESLNLVMNCIMGFKGKACRIREYSSTLYVGLASAVSPTNTNFRLTFLLTRLQEALYEDLAV